MAIVVHIAPMNKLLMQLFAGHPFLGDPATIAAANQAGGVLRAGIFSPNNDGSEFNPGTSVPNDVVPKDEDFIRVPFRMLSATIVAAGTWRATNFSDENALRASMGKLQGQPLYKDHNTESIDNSVGVVESVEWQEAFTTEDGQRVPAGISGVVKVDAKSYPTVARKLLQSPPAIHSVSVTVEFKWKASHDLNNEDEFHELVGTTGEDGRMITRDVTEIVDYYELSLVWMGADPYAKHQGPDGKPHKVDRSRTYESDFGRKLETENKFLVADSLTTKPQAQAMFERLSFCKDGKPGTRCASPSSQSKNSQSSPLMETLQQIAEALGFTLPEDGKFSAEQFEQMKKFAAAQEALKKEQEARKKEAEKLAAEHAKMLETLKAEHTEALEALKAEKAELEPFAQTGKDLVESLKAEARRLAIVAKGEPGKDYKEGEAYPLQKTIEKADTEELKDLVESLGGKVSERFTATCADCGSHKVSYRSTKPEPTPTEGTEPMGKFEPKSVEEIANEESWRGYGYR